MDLSVTLDWFTFTGSLFDGIRLLFVVTAFGLGLRGWLACARADRLTLAALVTGATLLRVGLATGGPGDLQLNVLFPHLGPANPSMYGALVRALGFHPVVLALPSLVAGALVPAVLFVVARQRHTGQVPALAVGLFGVMHPLLVRFSGEASTPSLVAFLGAVALVGLAGYRQGRGFSHLALYVLAALLLAGTRPEAAFLVGGLVAAAVTWEVASPPPRPHRRGFERALEATAHLALVAATFAIWMGSDQSGYVAHYLVRLRPHLPFLPFSTVVVHPTYTPLAAILLVVLGAWTGLRKPGPQRAWTLGLIVMAACVAWPVSIDPLGGSHLANARYHVGTLVPAALLFGLGVEALPRWRAWRWAWRRRAGRALVLVLAAGSWLLPLREVTAPRAVDGEFRFLLEEVPKLPAGSRIFYASRDVEIGFRPTVFRTAAARGLSLPQWHRWPEEVDAAGDGDRYFFYQAACNPSADRPGAEEVRRLCADAFERFGAHSVATDVVAARPYGSDGFSIDPLPLGLYRM